ncbi:glutamate receptor 2.8-like [Salvia divinorum]|uniref:Glutamate receptor 2.8-like n=1 Tax=Salvia divinorum TaxID=28513 RepID=A0ABD1G8Z3_SALDI
MNFDTSKLRGYRTLAEYDGALSKGSRNGGVAAIVDELPYIRLLLSKYCGKYTMIGPIYQTSGFGFAFQKGSPLVADVSRAILKLIEDEEMEKISRKWFREGGCRGSDGTTATVNSKRLSAGSFKGLFLVAGLSSSFALAVFLSGFVYENRGILSSTASTKHKIHALARAFYQKEEGLGRGRVSAASQEAFSQDEGPIHHATQG